MESLKKTTLFFGRIFISILFILSAINKIFHWQETQNGLVNLFYDWQSYISFSVTFQAGFANLIAWSQEILIVMTIFELVGGLLIFFGIKPKLGAILIILILLPTTFLLHPFWFLDGAKREMQGVLFLKNLAILGGLFFISVFGVKLNEMFSLPPSKND
ncbi:MAG: DoxX family protein [Chlamydiae bacterium]|nr:DoxX family protein [Chlamydiota bacterium]